MSDQFDIFNLDVEDMNFHEKEEKRKILYSPSYKDGKDNVYKAIIRLIPNPADPINKSISQKYTYWLDEPAVSVKGYFDSPASIGQDCPLGKTYWKLAKSESAIDQKNAEKLKRKEQFHSLAYIIKDPQNPDLEGQVMIFRYNKTIKNLIDEQKNPDTEMGMSEPVNVFDFFKGKDFLLQISSKGGYPDYTACKFAPNSKPISIEGTEVTKDAAGMQLIKDKVLNDAPDLSTYDYQPLTQDQLTQIYAFISTLTNDTSHLSSIAGGAAPSNAKPSAAPKVTPEDAVDEISSDSSDDFSEFDLEGSSEPETVTQTADATSDAGSDDDLDDFLANV